MEKILLDTDVIIDFLRGYQQRIKSIFEKIEQKQIIAYISTISIVELYAGIDIKDQRRNEILAQLLTFLEPIPLDPILSKFSGNLKSEYDLGLADAVIAASAINKELKLFTFNTKHFKKIPNCSFYSL